MAHDTTVFAGDPGERVLAGLRLAAGVDEDEVSPGIHDMLELVAQAANMRVVPLDWQPQEGKRVYPAMIEAMREVGAVAKLGDYKERSDGPVIYKFRGVDAVVNAAGPAFRKAGIIPVPTILAAERTPGTTKGGGSKLTTIIRVRYTFFAVDGSSIVLEVEGEANDTSDKGTGKAFSVAYRIALLQLLAIPTDDPDPDATRIEGDHTPPLSPALVAFILRGVRTVPLDGLEALYELLTAHVAPDSRVPGDDTGRVWWEVWGKRYVDEVEAASTSDAALRDLWKAVGKFGLAFRLGRSGDVNSLITSAAMRWSEREKLAIDEVHTMIRDADELPALDVAVEVTKAHLEEKRITSADSLALLEVIEKRRSKLSEVAAAAEGQAAANLATWSDGPPNDQDDTPDMNAEYHSEQGMY